MADEDQRKGKRKGGGRTTALAGLLAIVALVAAWLSDCIPGFGIGTQSGEPGEAEQVEKIEEVAPAKPEPESELEPAEPKSVSLTIDVRGCVTDGGEPFDCATLCERAELLEGVETVTIDAKDSPHATVVEVVDCLKSKHIAVAIERE